MVHTLLGGCPLPVLIASRGSAGKCDLGSVANMADFTSTWPLCSRDSGESSGIHDAVRCLELDDGYAWTTAEAAVFRASQVILPKDYLRTKVMLCARGTQKNEGRTKDQG